MFFNWILLIVSAFAILMFHLQIVYVEEVFLEEAFGDGYTDIRKKYIDIWEKTELWSRRGADSII